MADVGQVLANRYRLVELLGQGGMATIYRAHDGQLGRDVAVKVLRAEYGRDPAFVARFRQEAQSAAALSHPNVVNVFDYGMEAGDPFIVMELIDGGDLAAVIKERGALDPMAAARIAQQIFEALDTAHGRGIVHRDIKPTNVLLTSSGRVKVADFGIARAFSEAQLTMPGTTLGSVHYFSPEQARGEMVTTASDVYSAGLVLFEMLTARRAWTGDSAGAVAVARLAGDPPAPSSIHSGVPHILDVAVRRALARLPADRPTAGDMAALLGRYIADPAGASAPPLTTSSMGATPAVAYGPASGPQPGPGDVVSNGGVGFGQSMGDYGAPPRNMAYPEEHEDRGSTPWGWIAAILGVLVLFAGGVLIFLLLSGQSPSTSPTPTGRTVETPVLVGELLDDAERIAVERGLVLSIGGYEVSDAAPENTVIRQDPVAGGRVPTGSRVTVSVATQRQLVSVPQVRMRPEAEFFALLAQSSLGPGTRSEEFEAEVPAGLIVRTNPREGVQVARGTAVDYVVSLGPPPSPSPTPTTTPTLPPTEPPTGTVGPTPPPTAPPTPSPTLPPTVPPTPSPSLPPTPPPTPEPLPVGNYVLPFLADLGQAKAQIAVEGFTLGVVWPPEAADDWIVCLQFPDAGLLVAPGSFVHLFAKPPSEAC